MYTFFVPPINTPFGSAPSSPHTQADTSAELMQTRDMLQAVYGFE